MVCRLHVELLLERKQCQAIKTSHIENKRKELHQKNVHQIKAKQMVSQYHSELHKICYYLMKIVEQLQDLLFFNHIVIFEAVLEI